jgi:hypothetical protein
MDKLHITQDDYGYWMLSLERDDGTLSLLAHQFAAPGHLIENANELIAEGKVNAVIVIDPPRSEARGAAAAAGDYKKPAPRKAGA